MTIFSARLSRACLLACLLVPSVLVTTGCRPKVAARGPFDADAAERHAEALEAWLRKHPDDHRARLELGVVYWTHLAHSDKAREHLQRVADTTGHPLARFSLATIGQSQLDLELVWAQASALIREAPKREDKHERALALALTSPAARLIDAIQGQREGDEQEFAELFDAIAPAIERGVYPADAVHELLSTRAQHARNQGDDYRTLYRRQGCVQDWKVGVVEGHRGALELERLAADRSFTLDPEAQASASLSCAVRVWNPEPRVGIRKLRSVVKVPGEQLRLELAAQNPSRVYLDGNEIWASDRSDRYPVETPSLVFDVTPGEHLIEVRTALPGERAWVLVRASDAHGRPLETVLASEAKGTPGRLGDREPRLEVHDWDGLARDYGMRGPIYAPLRDFLALDDALADGDSDRAELISARMRDGLLREANPDDAELVTPEGSAQRFASAHLLLAEVELRDPSRGRTSSAARQQAELEQALELDPSMDRARLALLSLRLERGETAEVIEALEASPPDQLEGLAGAMLRYDAYRSRGSDLQAEKALARAAELHPDNCEVLLSQRELARERAQVRSEDALSERLENCPGTLALRARLAQSRQRLDEAEALWTEQLQRTPDDIDAMVALADLAISKGAWADAIAWHERMLALAPYRAVSKLALADLYARAGERDKARAVVRETLAQMPENDRLREIAEQLGIADPLMQFRVDGRDALASYRAAAANGEVSEGVSEVMLLDRQVSMLYPNGGHRHIVHQMFHILSDQAIDAHGEFNQPGVRLLTLHVIKPDGRIVEPESIAGKEGVSLRDLAIGDVVEVEFQYSTSPDPALPGHFDLGRFRFQSPDIPFHRSELIVLVPEAMEAATVVERRNAAPETRRRALELDGRGYVELSFRADRVPRLGAEPDSRSMLDELPMVQVHRPHSVEDWLDLLAAQLRAGQRSNPELRALVAELTGPYDTTYDKVDALWRFVTNEIEEAGDLSTPATITLSGRQGNRLILLRAMLEQAGIASELWLLRDRFGPTIQPGGDPLVTSYDLAVLAVDTGEGPPLLVSATSEVVPLGYVSPSYAGGKALRIQLEQDEGPNGFVDVPPQRPEHRDVRRWDIAVSIDAQGRGKLSGTLELGGIEAIQWRGVFDQIDEDRRPEVFIQAELARMLPGAVLDLDTLEFENEWALEQPLVIRFAAHGQNLGVVQQGQLALLAAAVPIDQATYYGRLPERWSGLLIGYAPRLEAKVRYALEGRRFAVVPNDVKIEGEFGTYVRSVTSGGAGESGLVLESSSTLTLGIVEPEEYPDLLRFAAQVQKAEQAIIRAR